MDALRAGDGPNGPRVIRTRLPAAAALTEWEVQEIVRQAAGGIQTRVIAALHGVSARTVYRYLARSFTCRHCRAEFRTVAALWDHMWLPLEEVG